MKKSAGKSIAISPFRKLVIDLLHFSQGVPTVAIDRRMNLAPLVAARKSCTPRPSWTAMFIKAYALVAARQPLLRRSYMSMPWPRFYEHPKNIVTINISRRVDDEDIVLQGQVRSPENRHLADLDAIIRSYKDEPVESFNAYRRVMRVSRLPLPIRRFVMWCTLNMLGRQRCHNLGTFGFTTLGESGAGVLGVSPILTSTVHYGLFDAAGCLDVRFTFDHRVMDGAPAAAALVDLENTLLGEVVDEVRSMGPGPRLLSA